MILKYIIARDIHTVFFAEVLLFTIATCTREFEFAISNPRVYFCKTISRIYKHLLTWIWLEG